MTKLRKAVFDLLGWKCFRCNFDKVGALQIDHVEGGGGRHKASFHDANAYHRAILEAKGVGFQILCANCNWLKIAENNEARGNKALYSKYANSIDPETWRWLKENSWPVDDYLEWRAAVKADGTKDEDIPRRPEFVRISPSLEKLNVLDVAEIGFFLFIITKIQYGNFAKVSVQDICQKQGVARRTVYRYLRHLEDAGAIERCGKGLIRVDLDLAWRGNISEWHKALRERMAA